MTIYFCTKSERNKTLNFFVLLFFAARKTFFPLLYRGGGGGEVEGHCSKGKTGALSIAKVVTLTLWNGNPELPALLPKEAKLRQFYHHAHVLNRGRLC